VVESGGEVRFRPEEAPILNVTHASMSSGARVVVSAGSGQKQFHVCVLTEAAPNARLDLRFEEEAVFRANGGEVALWGSTQGAAKRPRLDSASGKPASAAADSNKAPKASPAAGLAGDKFSVRATGPKAVSAPALPSKAPSTADLSVSDQSNKKQKQPTAKPEPKPAPQPKGSVKKVPVEKEQSKEKKVHTIVKKDLGRGLVAEVLQMGKGQAAKVGRRVTVKYEGRLTNGKKFDSGSITFVLGLGQVIKGWDMAVKGMLVGERRKLFIPAPLAYGRDGSPPVIPPNAPLIFDMTLLKC
jgi:FKBP-type peptidyl-prolyl cis-trans isomerase